MNALPRRTFLRLSALTTVGSVLEDAMAGPFNDDDFAALVPADKKLRPEWVRSLTERGTPTLYQKSKDELRYIGMPVGGIACGLLYLGGDGKLWLWDIFNQPKEGVASRPVEVPMAVWLGGSTFNARDGGGYVVPYHQQSPLQQGFSLRVNRVVRPLDHRGWQEVTFHGEYPVGTVRYTDPESPVAVQLEAFSPFIPLNLPDSSLPATVLRFTLTNTSKAAVTAELVGFLENAVGHFTAKTGTRLNTVQDGLLTCRLEPEAATKTARPDTVVFDFEGPTYGPGWTVEGTAFGTGPVKRKDIPAYQGDVGGEGDYVVNSHASAPGSSVDGKDAPTGRLLSPEFTLTRRFLTLWVGGGSNTAEVGVHLLVDGQPVATVAGRNSNKMQRESLDLSKWQGKTARLEIYDNGRAAWGNIGVDHVVLTDHPKPPVPLEKQHDFGTLALLCPGATRATAELPAPEAAFDFAPRKSASVPVGDERPVGALERTLSLAPGASETVTFILAWHFPNNAHLPVPDASTGNHYATRFADAAAAARYVETHLVRLTQETRLWRDTWYDSTLPHWFLDRTFANTCILATTTLFRLGTGRFWAWEGIGCCPGTCTHVWHYAQAPGRLFPELERDLRERVDFGVGFDTVSGMVRHRAEGTGPAVDGQCGRILGVLREHQLSPDSGFLKRLWPRVKHALEYLMAHDRDGDGLLDGAQENTLDAAWFGKIAWLSSLYAAALRAGEALAKDSGDTAFAALCAERATQTQKAIEAELFNGEFFIQKPEPGRERSLGTYETCHIDQVHGQSWAWQVGLPRVLDRAKTVSALKALYQYNFAPDVGPFRQKNRAGRPYALPGDGGLIMATNPKGLKDAFGNVQDWQFGYFNECMSGFEHQAASHMIAEGMVTEGLAVTRAIHDRYHAKLRNPYNEIECSDHYARAMASYGSFITLCGFTSHGPHGHLGFAPRLSGEFKAAFTAAEGWGTFALTATSATVTVKWGKVRLNTLALPTSPAAVRVLVGGVPVTASVAQGLVQIESGATLVPGTALTVEFLDAPLPTTRTALTQNRDHSIYDWQTRHAAVLARNKTVKPELVFIGDSITHYFAGEPTAPIARGPEAWKALCGGHTALNLGYGWDRVENVLWRVENGELAGISPKVITLLIGTNNIGHNTDDEIADGLGVLLQAIRTRQSKAKLLVLAVLPRRDALAKVAALNQKLAPVAKAHADQFLDIGTVFLDTTGTVPAHLMADGLHPTAEGYARLAAAVAPVLKKLLG